MDHIKAGKKEYPFQFSWSAYKKFIQTEQGGGDDYDLQDKGIYLGFVYGHKREKKDVFSMDEMLDMLDDYPKLHEEAYKLFIKGFTMEKKIQAQMNQVEENGVLMT